MSGCPSARRVGVHCLPEPPAAWPLRVAEEPTTRMSPPMNAATETDNRALIWIDLRSGRFPKEYTLSGRCDRKLWVTPGIVPGSSFCVLGSFSRSNRTGGMTNLNTNAEARTRNLERHGSRAAVEGKHHDRGIPGVFL